MTFSAKLKPRCGSFYCSSGIQVESGDDDIMNSIRKLQIYRSKMNKYVLNCSEITMSMLVSLLSLWAALH